MYNILERKGVKAAIETSLKENQKFDRNYFQRFPIFRKWVWKTVTYFTICEQIYNIILD